MLKKTGNIKKRKYQFAFTIVELIVVKTLLTELLKVDVSAAIRFTSLFNFLKSFSLLIRLSFKSDVLFFYKMNNNKSSY